MIATERATEDPVQALVRRVLTAWDYKPPALPDVAAEVLAIADSPSAGLPELRDALQRDPGIAGRVLALANSAAFRARSRIETLEDAITRLGLRRIRDITFQVVAEAHLFREPAYAGLMRQYRDHAVGAAHLARAVCEAVRLEANLAFVCGLLHDIGRVIVLGIIADAARRKGGYPPPTAEVEPTVDWVHVPAGVRVVQRWGLSPLVVNAVAHHHGEGTDCEPMALVVRAADRLCHHSGIGVHEVRPVVDAREPCFAHLGLGAEAVARLLRRADEVRDTR